MNAELETRLSVGISQHAQTGSRFASETISPGGGASTDVVNGSGVELPSASTDRTREPSSPDLLRSAEEKRAAPTEVQVNQAANTIEEFVGKNQRNLSFERDLDSGVMVITVVDKQSNDVIRKIPGEEAIEIAKRISELHNEITNKPGMFFEKEV